jgi:uncharacterized protein YbjT (DUF2867 family)
MGDKIIVVGGATGAQGGGLVRAILSDPDGGFAARALTRDPASPKARALADAGAEVVRADVDDQASLARAFEGAYGAYCVTFFWDHFGVAGEHLTGAEKAAGLSRALGREVVHYSPSFDAYRGFGFPGAQDLGNMFQFNCEFAADFCGARDIARSRQLNPAIQSFDAWLAANKGRIPLS